MRRGERRKEDKPVITTILRASNTCPIISIILVSSSKFRLFMMSVKIQSQEWKGFASILFIIIMETEWGWSEALSNSDSKNFLTGCRLFYLLLFHSTILSTILVRFSAFYDEWCSASCCMEGWKAVPEFYNQWYVGYLLKYEYMDWHTLIIRCTQRRTHYQCQQMACPSRHHCFYLILKLHCSYLFVHDGINDIPGPDRTLNMYWKGIVKGIRKANVGRKTKVGVFLYWISF